MTFAQLTWQPVSWLYIQTSLLWVYSSFWSDVNVTCGLILSIQHCSMTNECWLSVSDNDTSTVIGPDAVSYRMCPVHAHTHPHTHLFVQLSLPLIAFHSIHCRQPIPNPKFYHNQFMPNPKLNLTSFTSCWCFAPLRPVFGPHQEYTSWQHWCI